ncbi:CLUMA_CG001555, isoform A [Clunio marinus]|uniref:cardiolipin synthase (CMP-forming) n=1 Tax=Clunio marinus TaxID=568069 RepID=A0A1J1HIA9_9DIPT|nr:CLUMA_CG001555, isoform A [Clunio marinus]
MSNLSIKTREEYEESECSEGSIVDTSLLNCDPPITVGPITNCDAKYAKCGHWTTCDKECGKEKSFQPSKLCGSRGAPYGPYGPWNKKGPATFISPKLDFLKKVYPTHFVKRKSCSQPLSKLTPWPLSGSCRYAGRPYGPCRPSGAYKSRGPFGVWVCKYWPSCYRPQTPIQKCWPRMKSGYRPKTPCHRPLFRPCTPCINYSPAILFLDKHKPICLKKMFCLRLFKLSSGVSTLNRAFSITLTSEFRQIPTKRLSLLKHVKVTAFYCTQVKKNILATKTVKGTTYLQEAYVKRKEKFKEKKQQIEENIRDTKTRVRVKVEEVIERENIFTIPNWLCVGRIFMSPYLGYVIIQNEFALAMGLMIAAGLTDLADGYIARNWKGQKSNFGSFLDPLADKCLMGTLVVSLGYCNLMPLWLAATILFRDVFLIAAAFVIRYRSLPPTHRTWTRYFDATHATAQLAPTFTSKVNTAVQLFAVAASLGAPIWNYVDHSALHGLWYLTGVTTAAAAISYLVKKDTYKYLRREIKRK